MSEALTRVLAAAGLRGWVHAVDIDSGCEVGLLPDVTVVAASVFKIPVLVELCCQAAEGKLDLTHRIELAAEERRVDGLTGLSVFQDSVSLSVRDAALLMMSISDNRATDVIIDLIGLDRINTRMAELGLHHTRLETDCRGLLAQIDEDLGEPWTEYVEREPSGERMRTVRSTTPSLTNRTTAREITSLLTSVWRDDGLPVAACREIRRVMAMQVFSQRLASGFPEPGWLISAKTGTLCHLRSEAGVVEEQGFRCAVGVFVDCESPAARNPSADRAIGAAARVAVEEIREKRA